MKTTRIDNSFMNFDCKRNRKTGKQLEIKWGQRKVLFFFFFLMLGELEHKCSCESMKGRDW